VSFTDPLREERRVATAPSALATVAFTRISDLRPQQTG